jgi:polar amino acid transport system substrate-binding protein
LFVRFFLYALLWGLISCPAKGSPQTADELSVAIIHIPPYIISKPSPAKPTGLAIRAVNRMASECGLKTHFILAASWKRAYQMGLTGKVDAVIPAHYTAERTVFFEYPPSPILNAEMVLFAHASAKHKSFTGLPMLKSKIIGTVIGGISDPAFDAFIKANHISNVKHVSFQSLLLALSRKRIDFLAGNLLVGTYVANKMGIADEIQALKPRLGLSPLYLAVSKQRHRNALKEQKISGCLLK